MFYLINLTYLANLKHYFFTFDISVLLNKFNIPSKQDNSVGELVRGVLLNKFNIPSKLDDDNIVKPLSVLLNKFNIPSKHSIVWICLRLVFYLINLTYLANILLENGWLYMVFYLINLTYLANL